MSNCPPLSLDDLIDATENLRTQMTKVGINAADAAKALQNVMDQLGECPEPSKLDEAIELLKKYDNNKKNS